MTETAVLGGPGARRINWPNPSAGHRRARIGQDQEHRLVVAPGDDRSRIDGAALHTAGNRRSPVLQRPGVGRAGASAGLAAGRGNRDSRRFAGQGCGRVAIGAIHGRGLGRRKKDVSFRGRTDDGGTQLGARQRRIPGFASRLRHAAVSGLVRPDDRVFDAGSRFARFRVGVCFVLFFWANFLHGTAGWLEILLFATGIACLVLELLVLPGFGAFGVGGGFLIVASIILASQTFVIPSNAYEWSQLPGSLFMAVAAGAGASPR